MKRFNVAVALALAFAIAGGTSAPALADSVCAPSKMVHIQWTDVTPGLPSGSFGSKPRDVYRLGSDKSRLEEAVDADNRLQELIVVAEPNIWLINLYDHSGKHIVDPGPTFFARDPVIGIQGLPEKLLRLELGCEADFFAANAPKPARTEQVDGQSFDVYRVTDGSHAIELLERAGTSTPAYARYYHAGDLTFVIRYDRYETGLAADPSLFTPPSGIHLTDVGK